MKRSIPFICLFQPSIVSGILKVPAENFTQSDGVFGLQDGNYQTNLDQLTNIDFEYGLADLAGIRGCVATDSDSQTKTVTGIQLVLQIEQETGSKLVDLNPIGSMSNTDEDVECSELIIDPEEDRFLLAQIEYTSRSFVSLTLASDSGKIVTVG
jgi:hypothetical protein